MCLNHPKTTPSTNHPWCQRVGGCYSRDTPTGVEDGRLLSLQSHISVSLILFFRFLSIVYSANPVSWWASRLLVPSHYRWQEPDGKWRGVIRGLDNERGGGGQNVIIQMDQMVQGKKTWNCASLSPVGPTGSLTRMQTGHSGNFLGWD